jgi:hypothetical protein
MQFADQLNSGRPPNHDPADAPKQSQFAKSLANGVPAALLKLVD